MLNIGGDGADKSYRYKMPRLQTKVEGRGNGIKTAIPNMVDIAKALHTPPSYPTKFFGLELGAQSKFDKKTERAIVNGAHQNKDMQTLLGKFIDLFILCPTCKLPELAMSVKKNSIKIDCAACGHNGDLPHQHKLTTYILKNPPKGKTGKTLKVEAPQKRERKNKGGGAKNEDDGEEDGGEDEGDGEEAGEGAGEAGAGGAAAAAPAAAGAAAQPDEGDDLAAPPVQEERGEVEWFSDISKEAQLKRKEAEFSEMKAGSQSASAIDKILDKAKAENREQAPVTVLKVFLARGNRQVAEIVSEVRRLQLARGLDDSQRLKVLLEALLNPQELNTAHTQLASNAALLKQYATNKSTGLILIQCVEELVGVTIKELLPRTPLILQALYDADVLTEDMVLSWADSPPESSYMVTKEVANAVRKKAQPFVDWLKQAESGEEEEED